MLSASCHCGAVRLEIKRIPRSVTECTCSICHRYGARWAYYTRKSVRVISTDDALVAYLWGDRTIEFYHCRHCGCVTHYESVEKDDKSRIAVNARTMLPVDISNVPVRTFDGASSWKYV
jgi:hypothetical protein